MNKFIQKETKKTRKTTAKKPVVEENIEVIKKGEQEFIICPKCGWQHKFGTEKCPYCGKVLK